MTKDRKAAWGAMERLVPLVLKVLPAHLRSRPLAGSPPGRVESSWWCVYFVRFMHDKLCASVCVLGSIGLDWVSAGGGRSLPLGVPVLPGGEPGAPVKQRKGWAPDTLSVLLQLG